MRCDNVYNARVFFIRNADCPVGKFLDATQAGLCVSCGWGFYSDTVDTAACTQCAVGQNTTSIESSGCGLSSFVLIRDTPLFFTQKRKKCAASFRALKNSQKDQKQRIESDLHFVLIPQTAGEKVKIVDDSVKCSCQPTSQFSGVDSKKGTCLKFLCSFRRHGSARFCIL